MEVKPYKPAWWLGPHSSTVWGRLFRKETLPPLSIEKWDTPDSDFLELARYKPDGATPETPRLLVLHGLEGGLHSHYVRGLFREAASKKWAMDLLFFRTCGPSPNLLPRSYHSGETEDLSFVLNKLGLESQAPLGVLGISLGGNVLAKMLGEKGSQIPPFLAAAACISVPWDLARASAWIGKGFGTVYEKAFLRSLIPKALAKIQRHPELNHLTNVAEAKTLWQFDDLFTAPLHGFLSAKDYYSKSSAIQFVGNVTCPTLLLSAVDDPFLPSDVLEEVQQHVRGKSNIQVDFPRKGGHVGFVSGRNPWRPSYYGEWRPVEFISRCFADR